MQVKLLLFGRIIEILGTTTMMVEGIQDTDALKVYLLNRYPTLNAINYAIAVNEQIIAANTTLKEDCIVAILPPYSGG